MGYRYARHMQALHLVAQGQPQVAEPDQGVDPRFEVGIDEGLVDLRVVTEVDALRRVRIGVPHQVLMDLF